MADQPTCIDCGESAPTTESTYTLISATHGWRLARRILADGTRGVEWRCPTCWSAHKGGEPVTKTGPSTSTTPRRRA